MIRVLLSCVFGAFCVQSALAAPPELVVQTAVRAWEGAAALSPDGNLLAVCTDSRTRIYATQSGELRRVLNGGGRPTWSNDGKVLAVGGEGVRLWKMPSATLLRFERRGGGGASFDASGQRFACRTKEEDLSGAVFETFSARIVGKSPPATELLTFWEQERALLAPNGRQFLTFNARDYSSREKPTIRVALWDVASGDLVREFTSIFGVRGAAWSPDGTQIALAQEANTLVLWNPRTGATQKLSGSSDTSSSEWLWNVVFSRDGQTLVSSSTDSDNALRFWKMPSGELQKSVPLPRGATDSFYLSASSDLKMFALRGGRGGAALMDSDGKPGRELAPQPPRISTLAWSRDSKMLAHDSDESVRIWDLQTGTLRASPPVLGRVAGLSFRPSQLRGALGIDEIEDGRPSGFTRGEVWNWNLANGQLGANVVLNSIDPKSEEQQDDPTLLSPGGVWTARHSGYDNRIPIHDAQTGRIARVLKVPDQGMGFAFGDDNFAATAERNGTIRVWNLQTGTNRVVHLNTQGNAFEARIVSFSPKLNWVAGGGYRGLCVWAARGAHQKRWLGTDNVSALDWSPDEKWLAVADDKGQVALWKHAAPGSTKAQRVVLGFHQGAVSVLKWSPDGRFLASCGSDGAVRIWSVSSTKPALHLTMWNFPIDETRQSQWLAISPDGTWNATPSATKWARWRNINARVDEALLPLETRNSARDPALLRKRMSPFKS